MEYIRKKGFSLNFCYLSRACGKKHSVATQRPEDQLDQCVFSANEFWRGNTYNFILRSWNPILWMMRHAGCVSWHEDHSRWCGAAGLHPCCTPCCSSNWSVSLGSRFVPVKPFSYLLHAARVAKVEAQRQVIQTHNTYGESFNDCVSPETTVSW